MASGDVRETVAAAFNDRYAGQPYTSEVDGATLRIPPLEASELKVVSEEGGITIVRHDPLTGVIVEAEVAPDGTVTFSPLSFATE